MWDGFSLDCITTHPFPSHCRACRFRQLAITIVRQSCHQESGPHLTIGPTRHATYTVPSPRNFLTDGTNVNSSSLWACDTEKHLNEVDVEMSSKTDFRSPSYISPSRSILDDPTNRHLRLLFIFRTHVNTQKVTYRGCRCASGQCFLCIPELCTSYDSVEITKNQYTRGELNRDNWFVSCSLACAQTGLMNTWP